MAKKQIDLGLTGLDELFMDDRERAESKLPKIHEIPLSEIDEFPNHPFHVRLDEDMDQLVESIKERGIITPVTLRQKPDGRYEIVSGHRRTKACELAGLTTVKAEIKELSRDEAIILMVESNLQRTTILPSEKAFSYKMRLEAMNRQADPVEDAPEDVVEDERLAAYASTVTNVLLFDKASPNYTTVLRSQVSVTYNPNGSDAAKTAYIKNLGWHFARYNNVPYEDDPLYCIEPCKNYAASTSGNYMDEDLGVSGSSSTRGSNVWYAMPYSYRQAIALTLLYSRQLWDSNYSVKTTAMANNPNVSTRIATQFLIYEIVTGLRDADTFNRRGSNGYTSGDVFYNAGVASVSGFAEKYNSIVSSVQNAMKIPSFTSRSSGSAPTITMSGNQVSVTDSNGVLGNFSFTNGNGASFSKSGNTLTITKTGSISPTALFSATRSLPSAENSTVSIYYSASSTYQTCVKLYSPQVDTLRAYFRINAPDPGAIALVKTTEDGQNLSGWRFGVYSNAACTTLVSGPHTTDTSGRISIPGLNAGTYYIKELGHTNSAISSRYTCSGENPKMLSISNGTTTSVNFYNKLTVGALEIRKSTNTGNHLGGWKFIVKKDGAEIPGSPFTTDTTGRIHISNLIPGKYLVMESPTEDPYWSVELGFHTVTVEYGKNAVDQWLNGICVLGEPSEENLAAASKTSGEDGLLTWKALPITLQYRITETNAPDGYTLLKDYAFAGTLPADNTEMELRVVNGEAFALPKTGSTGFVRIPMATVFCLMLCAANLWLLRKKEQ